MTALTRNTIATLQLEILAATAALAEKNGVTIRTAGGSFGASAATLKFEIALVSPTGAPTGRFVDKWKANARFFGFVESDLGREFIVKGKWYRITGLNTRCRKFPVMVERAKDCRVFKMPSETVRRALA